MKLLKKVLLLRFSLLIKYQDVDSYGVKVGYNEKIFLAIISSTIFMFIHSCFPFFKNSLSFFVRILNINFL